MNLRLVPPRLVVLNALVVVSALCQTAPDYSHFEVAAVKASVPKPNLPLGRVPAPDLRGGPGTTSPEQINYSNVTPFTLVLQSFDVRSMQVVFPGKAPNDLYDISATLPAGTTKEQLKVMFQNFLAERFHLELHHETRVLPVYAMTVGKNGLKIKESSTEPSPTLAPGTAIGKPDAEGYPQLPPGFAGTVGQPGPGRIRWTGQKATLAQIGSMVENRLDHPLVDQTGNTNLYDFKMDIENMQRAGAAPVDPSDPAPSPAQALDKLGLKLELKQLPFDVLIIDRLDKTPTEN